MSVGNWAGEAVSAVQWPWRTLLEPASGLAAHLSPGSAVSWECAGPQAARVPPGVLDMVGLPRVQPRVGSSWMEAQHRPPGARPWEWPPPRPLPTARPWPWGVSAPVPTIMVVPVSAKGRGHLWLPGRWGLQGVF